MLVNDSNKWPIQAINARLTMRLNDLKKCGWQASNEIFVGMHIDVLAAKRFDCYAMKRYTSVFAKRIWLL